MSVTVGVTVLVKTWVERVQLWEACFVWVARQWVIVEGDRDACWVYWKELWYHEKLG